MAENTNNRLTGMLLSKSRRAQYLKVFAVLAACVVVAVAIVLHQNGVAMTHKEQVLTCPVTGAVAHTHDESCYDKDGNLVCTLPERELHTHTDACYTETRELTCGLEESDGHKHTEACYDANTGELICGLEESEGHHHTDACYTVTRELTCGLEEITETHVHGPGCFTTVEVEDTADNADADKNSEVVTSQSQPMPAQQFDEDILDDKGNLWVHVSVKAPEGAFPEGTTMRVAPLDAESVRTKVEDALKKNDALVSGAKQMKAVDITFFNKEGKEIEPAVDVEVKLTSDTVRSIKDPVLVHVDKDEAKEAEVLKKVDVVNKNEEDKTEETKDTLKFESNAFSPYVIVEPKVISAKVITASGDTYNITVSYGEEAKIPSDATLSVKEITEGKEGYEELANQTVEAVNTDADSVETLRMFDITILGADGNVLEPLAPVEVKIELEGNQITEDSELKVVHFANNGTKVIDPATETKDDTTDTLTFTTDSFSVYSVLSWKEKLTGIREDGEYAIVSAGNNGNDFTGYAMRAKAAEKKNNNKYEEYDGKLAAEQVTITNNEGKRTITTSGDNSLMTWTFEKVPYTSNQYYISAGNNSYLNISDDGKLSVSNRKQALTLSQDNNRTIKIKYNTKCIKYSSDIGNNIKGFETDNTGANLILVEVEEKLPDHTGGPTEVPTVSDDNITIHMFDYPGTGTGANPHSELDQYLKEDPWNSSNTRLPTQDLASTVLQPNGYPTFDSPSGGQSDGALIFDPATTSVSGYYRGSASNLFLQSVYNQPGHYFEYDSANNFAYFDQKEQRFRVYKQLGSWNMEDNAPYNNNGEFYPFFDLDMTRSKIREGNKRVYGLKDSAGNKVDQADACYFGMSMEFSFLMPEAGKIDDQPMKYEFSGDDDVWVYIDDVLILDIGGRHESSEGSIDFSTGIVKVKAVADTTIFQRFKDARKLPDGKDWPANDDSTILDKYFIKVNGNYATLKPSFMPHEFKMFYLEHYATASNLKVRFNMAPIPSGNVVIQKKLDDNTQEAYANKEFTFQLDESSDNGQTWTPVQVDGQDTFTLKAGDAQKIIDGIDLVNKIYRIKELNIDGRDYSSVQVDHGTLVHAQDGSYIWRPTEDHQKINVTFKNISSDQNTNNLLITKKIADDKQTEDKFKFKIQLENKNGELVPYKGGTYYITKDNTYYKVNNGALQPSQKDQAKLTADSEGITEAIPQDFTIVVEGLIAGTDFKVEEVGLNSNDWKEPNKAVENAENGDIEGTDGKIKYGVDAQVIVTNRQNIVETEVSLKKVNDNNTLLGEATFKLLDANRGSLKENISPGSTVASNPLSLGKLQPGTYYLVEVTAPNGYTILVKEVQFKVNEDGSVELVGNYGQQVTKDGSVTNGFVITIKNTPGTELPKTGGIGTTAIYATGAALVGIAAYGLVSKKLRNDL